MSTGLQFTADYNPAAAIVRFRARFHADPTHAESREGRAWGALPGRVNLRVPAGNVLLVRDEQPKLF